ncbi:MAG: hypothetical protein Q4D38_07885 [Planctomycetia bacterium]|nr:hypothetical protein [Planctomycetia bacterium]
MMNIFSDGMRFLEECLGEFAVPVVYRRGETALEILAVRAGVSWNAIQRSAGAALESSVRDFILKKSALDFEPLPKDTITDGVETWTVVAQYDNECWRTVGDSGLIRVHCRK